VVAAEDEGVSFAALLAEIRGSNSRLVLRVGLDHASKVAERGKVLLRKKEREKAQHL